MTEVKVKQIFSRRGVGFIWNKRNELDPGQLSIINSMYKNKKKGLIDCEQEITYKLSRKAAGVLGYGRYYGTKGSLETLEKECRGTICKDYYHDIDITNCHFVLLEQFAKTKYNKDLPEVNSYIQNRETVLQNVGGKRDDAKEEVIRALYGANTKNRHIYPLSVETRTFAKFLATEEEYKELFNICKKEDNIYGSFLSFILQTEERKCMISMKEFLENQKWSVDVLAYDGVMIRKRADYICDSQLLRNTETAIKQKTGYKVELVNKEFQYYEIPVLSEEVAPGVTKDAYEEMKALFEETHFVHETSGQTGKVMENGEIIFMDAKHAKIVLLKWNFKHSHKFGDYTPFFDIWIKDVNHRLVSSIDMKPSDDPAVFSPPMRWAYLASEPPHDPSPYISLFQTLLTSLIPRTDMRLFVTEWLAHILQKPFENPKCGVILTGGKGCGKDTLGDFFSRWVLGYTYAANYDSNQQFWERHDSGRMNKLFVKLEEASGFLNKQNESNLKARVTADVSTFNPKGTKEIVVANYNRYLMTTNDYNPIATDSQERRFIIVACSDELIGKIDFWKEVRETLFTAKGGRAIADYLLGMEIDAFPRPLIISDLAQDITDSQESSEDKFLHDWDGIEVSAIELYNLYLTYCQNNSLPHCFNAISFGKRLIKPVAEGQIMKRRHYNIAMYYKSSPSVTQT